MLDRFADSAFGGRTHFFAAIKGRIDCFGELDRGHQGDPCSRFVGAFWVDVKQLEDRPPLTEIDSRLPPLVRKLELFLHGLRRLWLPKDMQ